MKGLLSSKEAAKYIGISDRSLRSLRKKGTVKAIRFEISLSAGNAGRGYC